MRAFQAFDVLVSQQQLKSHPELQLKGIDADRHPRPLVGTKCDSYSTHINDLTAQ
jgi:hypothetical protein